MFGTEGSAPGAWPEQRVTEPITAMRRVKRRPCQAASTHVPWRDGCLDTDRIVCILPGKQRPLGSDIARSGPKMNDFDQAFLEFQAAAQARRSAEDWLAA